MVKIIVACTNKGGIGKLNNLPWQHIKEDMKIFKDITFKNTIVMGRKTWQSLPTKPLKNRTNIIVSTTLINTIDLPENTFCIDNIENAIKKYPNAIYIGGSSIYNYLIDKNLVTEAHISFIKGDFDCDTFININMLRNKPHYIKEHVEYKNFIYLHLVFT